MLSGCSHSLARRNSITRGEQPTVFSLKSRRSFPARPPVGGEYGAILRTAGRGVSASIMAAHLGRSRVRLQPFGACQFRDRGCEPADAFARKLLNRDDLD